MALIRVMATVTGVAIFGMLLGAAFGWIAATIAPSLLFKHHPLEEHRAGWFCDGARGVRIDSRSHFVVA